jgi:peptide/nickel transport system permease protein
MSGLRGIPAMILLLWALLALAGPWLPLTPDHIDLTRMLAVPDPHAWLGHDDLGRPVWDRLVMGARTSLLVALWVVLVSAVTGTLIGTFSGYLGGIFDLTVVHVIDVFLAFPGILLAIALSGLLGPGIGNVVIALSVVGWVGYARLARAQVLTIKQREHVQAAVALGARRSRIVFRHLLPLIAAPLIIEATFSVAAVVIAEAGLSFLGLGVQPPQASWGSMIRDGTRYMLVAPHLVLAPGIALMCVVLAVNLLGDRLRDRMDVRLRVGTVR